MSKHSRLYAGGTVAALTLALAAFFISPAVSHALNGVAEEEVDLRSAQDLSEAFRAVAKKVRPSVVSIRSVKVTKLSGNASPKGSPPGGTELPEEFRRFFGDDEFREFFERRGPRGSRILPQQERSLRSSGAGSGVIVTADGYILTNNHVVENADELTVVLHDGRQLDAKIIGTDAETDLAVIKVEGKNLVPAVLGDSDALEVGDWVLAAGSPFGLAQTITAGIVSATGRSDMEIAEYEDFIQTDAAINPGNSGGPLLNLRGEVIGINTAIASRSGGNSGIGFAIPSSFARMFKEDIIADGKIDRGRIGVAIQTLTPGLAKSFNHEGRGVLIGDVMPNSPGEKAGLKSGDIVTEFDGKAVTTANQLRNRVAMTQPGTKSKLEIVRNGKDRSVSITIGRRDDAETVTAVPTAPEVTDTGIGLRVAPVDDATAEKYGFDRDLSGVVITGITPDSDAAGFGFRTGDVIVNINGKPVTSVADFEKKLNEKTLADGVRVQIVRDGVRLFLFAQVR